MTWTGGVLDGTGMLRIAPEATVTLSGTGTKLLSGARIIENEGTLHQSGSGQFFINQNSTAQIRNRGLFLISGTGPIGSQQLGVTASIINTGTIRKTGAGAAEFHHNFTFTNSGMVQVEAGLLRLFVGGTHTGSWSISPGAELSFHQETNALQAAGSLSNQGLLSINGGTTNIDSAYAGTGAVSVNTGILNWNAAATLGSVTLSGGTLAGSGAL